MSAKLAREHFIPIRKAELVELLCREPGLTDEEKSVFRRFCTLLYASIHREFHQHLEALKDAYAAFDPDADTRALVEASAEEKQRRLDELFQQIVWMLERANFHRLSHAELEVALAAATAWGLAVDVDLSVFDRLEIFWRGQSVQTRKRRRLRKLYRSEDVEVPMYQRLVIAIRLKPHERLGKDIDTDSVFLKVFKDIPRMDLDMLLPGTRVKMSLLDRGKVGLPLLTGVGITGWKLATGVLFTLAAGLMNTLALLGLAGGTIGYAVRSFYGYVRTKQKYQLTLTESLYFQNLANNSAALFALLDKAEEQECREAVLAYTFLWRHAPAAGWTNSELDHAIEEYLQKLLGEKPDFEIGDAVAKLERLGLVESLPDQRHHACPIATALQRMDKAWDNVFEYPTAK